MMNNWTDGTRTYVYFTYVHSKHEAVIIPEFPLFVTLLLSVTTTLLALIVCRKDLEYS